MALCVSSCFKEKPGLTITPESVTLKVAQSVQLHPGTVGEGISFSDIKIINSEEGICFLDDRYIVTGLKVGTSCVGVGVLNDNNDFSKGLKYSAYTVVKVVE
ncbi:MAG: hypothetical protein MJY97_03290 [Bacteroidales bacterium]|nr:hypothetical protein [Bacteroidales bacterium]